MPQCLIRFIRFWLMPSRQELTAYKALIHKLWYCLCKLIFQSNKVICYLLNTQSLLTVCVCVWSFKCFLRMLLYSSVCVCVCVCVRMCSPCAHRCTGSCRQGRRADGWGLRGGGSAAEPAGCRLGRSRGQRSGSKSHRRKQTGRGWSQSRRWCHFGPASSLQRRQESGIWQGFQPFKKVHKTQLSITTTQSWFFGSSYIHDNISQRKVFLHNAHLNSHLDHRFLFLVYSIPNHPLSRSLEMAYSTFLEQKSRSGGLAVLTCIR